MFRQTEITTFNDARLHNSLHLSATRGGSPAGCTCLILKSILLEPVIKGINLLNLVLLPSTTVGDFATLLHVKNKQIYI